MTYDLIYDFSSIYIPTYHHYIHTIIQRDINDDRQIDQLIQEKIWQDIYQITNSSNLQEWD